MEKVDVFDVLDISSTIVAKDGERVVIDIRTRGKRAGEVVDGKYAIPVEKIDKLIDDLLIRRDAALKVRAAVAQVRARKPH